MDLRNRVILLDKAQTDPELQAVLLELCSRDVVYWFNTFCWTFDPRTEQGALPFELYGFQAELLRQWQQQIEKKEDFGIEKSRDMGVSWLILLLFQWFWLFKPGNDFKVGSKKEDDVDILGNINTLFEKLRFNLRRLPPWMRPIGFLPKNHNTFAKLINPANGNIIAGESSNADFSRAGRYSAILFDEFAFWPFGDAAWASASQSTPCRVDVSTPYGKGNKHAKLMCSRDPGERIKKKFTVHWSLHPHKDQAWYANEKTRNTPDEIARELDISYDFSVSGTVFAEFSPRAHKIVEPYVFRPEWPLVAAFDFGSTCCVLLTQIDPKDTLHVFKEIILYQNGNTEDIAQAYLNYAATLDIRSRVDYVCDPAGVTGEFKTKQKTTDVQVLEGAGIKPVQYFKAQKMQKRLEDGIQMMKKFLSTRYQGSERIQIYEVGCPTLIEAFQSEYRYKTDNKGERLDVIEQKHPWEDVMDCLRYTIIEKFTVNKPDKALPAFHAPKISFKV